MDLVINGFIFIVGACLGSFLNVVAMRYIREESIGGRSYCSVCHKTLRWWELIPVFSFLAFGAKCISCRAPLSWQYPLVEIINGLLWVGAFSVMPQLFIFNFLLAIWLSILFVLFLIDLHIFILPDIYVLLLLIVTIGLLIIMPHPPSLLSSMGGVAIGSGFLGILWLITRGKGIGLGDVKLLVPLGALLGIQGIIVHLWISFALGGLLGIYLLIRHKAHLKTPLPFGPFLSAVAALLILFPHFVEVFFSVAFGIS